jgi:hypothetical protein
MRNDKPDQGFEDHGGDREDAGLLDDEPKCLALEQKLEVSEPNESLH